MKKLLFPILLLFLCLFAACASPSASDNLEKAAAQIEQALPEEFEKQSETQVYDFTFSNDSNGTITYYICLTTYLEADPDAVSGLDLNALSAVFDTQNTPVLKEMQVGGCPAAIYQSGDTNYLCCTSSPETSMVLEYDPDTLPEADALRVMQSVFDSKKS